MTRQVTLTVNNNPVQLDFYVGEVVYHITAGIVGSLQNTGDIKDLELTADSGRVTIVLNGEGVSLKEFPMLIITSILEGMVKPLKGATSPVKRVVITIRQ